MGGDHAPSVVVEGAVAAVRAGRARVVLAGPADGIQRELARYDVRNLPLTVVDAPDVIGMHERPLVALRRKPQSSVSVAARLVASGEASAMFTAGHSGAAVLAAHATLGMMAGVERPALAVIVPTRAGAAVLLDVGANVDCRPGHLVDFARLGVAYARVMLGVERPKVGLLSIGEEAGKGNDLIREAHERLERSSLAYIGNLEARDLFTGAADVAVCDGFTGNVALKVGEGLAEAIAAMIREELNAEVVSKIGELFTRRAFDRFRQRMDASEYGAAPLLGINGLVLVGHGRSTARAVESGIALASRLAAARLVDEMASGV
jgi:phosphate acyltransferase